MNLLILDLTHVKRAIALVLAVYLIPAFLAAQSQPPTQVLLYYNSGSPGASAGPMTVVKGILEAAGAQVATIDVNTPSYCPTGDNWGAYQQVWDLRCLNISSSSCPQVSTAEDAFEPCWISKSTNYLQSGGNLYLAGEYDLFNRKNPGISDLLLSIGAVTSGYTECPGPDGNGLDMTSAILPCAIPGTSGPISFSGRAVGGIPVPYLNGSRFVGDPVPANWGDGVDRAIAAGWRGSAGQMTQLTGNVGNLVTVWDTSYLDFSSLPSAVTLVNTGFVEGVYCYLGGGACSTAVPTPTPTPTWIPVPSPTPTPTYPPLDRPLWVSQNAFYPGPTGLPLVIRTNIRYTGVYSLRVYNSAGERVKTLREETNRPPGQDQVGWDGKNDLGGDVSSGLYIVMLTESSGAHFARVLVVR